MVKNSENIEKEEDLNKIEESSYKIPIPKVIGVFIALISVVFASSMLVESSYYFIGGTILFITGLFLQFMIKDIDKEHFLFKISNLSVLYLLVIGVFIATLNIMDSIMDEYGMVLPIKLIEIPALILSIYFYYKYKNNYTLFTSFLIFNLMMFVSLNLLLEGTSYKESIAENSPLALAYFSIIMLLCLKYSNKLISEGKKTYNFLILTYNLIGTIFYLDIYHEETHLYFIGLMIISNLILLPINIKYGKKDFNKLLIPVSIIWLIMPIILAFFN